MTVRRPLPGEAVPSIGPVIFFDRIGPFFVDAGTLGATPPHPHAGLDTLSCVMAGCAGRRDSLGRVVAIAAGDTQWMRAGRGIIHTEGPG